MVLCDEQRFRQIGKYIQVPVNKVSTDAHGKLTFSCASKRTHGFGTIVLHLAKQHKCPQFGNSVEDEALVRQWIEYVVTYVNYADSPAVAERVLKELNTVLAAQTYFVDHSRTLADIVMYYVLYSVMEKLSYQDKERFLHVSRWFDNLQHDRKLRQNNNLITFSRTPLFS